MGNRQLVIEVSALGSIDWVCRPALTIGWPGLLVTANGTASTNQLYRPRQTMAARKIRRYARGLLGQWWRERED